MSERKLNPLVELRIAQARERWIAATDRRLDDPERHNQIATAMDCIIEVLEAFASGHAEVEE